MHMLATRLRGLVLFLCFASAAQVLVAAPANVLQVDYDGFTVWLDCDRHGAYRFAYSVGFDNGHEPRKDTFELDPGVPAACQPNSAATFRTPDGAPRFDRGHLVPANHMDGSAAAIAESNYMTNVMPQTATLNRGAWLATEEIIECYRDQQAVQVIGGALWGNNVGDDYFVASHGIATPDRYWKVIILADGQALAWLLPNNTRTTRKRLDKYLVRIADLEKKTGEKFPVSKAVRKRKPVKSWAIPENCDKS